MTKKHKFFIATVGIFSLFLFVSVTKGKPIETPEDKLRGDCDRVAQRYVDAFKGTGKAGEDQLQASVTWFANKHGLYPELLCPMDKPFFAQGVR